MIKMLIKKTLKCQINYFLKLDSHVAEDFCQTKPFTSLV